MLIGHINVVKKIVEKRVIRTGNYISNIHVDWELEFAKVDNGER